MTVISIKTLKKKVREQFRKHNLVAISEDYLDTSGGACALGALVLDEPLKNQQPGTAQAEEIAVLLRNKYGVTDAIRTQIAWGWDDAVEGLPADPPQELTEYYKAGYTLAKELNG